jgi:cyclophilin family peptidyl-prolyl cis-trans isomerase
MKKLFVIPFLFLLLACNQDYEIPQEKVGSVLTAFGKENPENEVVINTNFGEIHIKLYDETPLHRANFIRLVKGGYFTDRKIYRIVKGLCIQGGGENSDKLKYLVPSEFHPNLIHKKGALSMARYDEGNPLKMSSATEFFIITKGLFYGEEELQNYPENTRNIYLKTGGEKNFDQLYTVFGEVTKGIEIAEKISKLEVIDTEKPLKKPNFSIHIKK